MSTFHCNNCGITTNHPFYSEYSGKEMLTFCSEECFSARREDELTDEFQDRMKMEEIERFSENFGWVY